MQVVLSSFRVASASNVVDGVNDVGGRSRRFDDCTVLPGWSCERGLFEFVLCFKGNVGGFARRCDGIDGACCAEVGGGATSETGRGGGHCKVVVWRGGSFGNFGKMFRGRLPRPAARTAAFGFCGF